MKKVVCLTLLISCLWSISCNKDGNIPLKDSTEIVSNYQISQKIIDYDQYLYSNPIDNVNVQTLGNFEELLDYAKADGMSAWSAFKLTAGLVGPGYAAALGMLAGVCGSLYQYIRNNYDFRPITANNDIDGGLPNNLNAIPMGATTQYPYSLIGTLHNNYLDSMVNRIENGTMGFTTNETYNYLISKSSIEFDIHRDSLMKKLPISEYQKIIDYNMGSLSASQIYALTEGMPLYLRDYMNEFLTRVMKPENASYDVAMNYVNLFLDDVENQSSFTQSEKNGLQYSLSIFKQSLIYWNSKL